MAKKKRRSCVDCMGYCNMLGGKEYRCGLGFLVQEEVEGGYGTWDFTVHPFNDECEMITLPNTREEFVEIASRRGIDWDIDDILTVEEYNSALW